MKLSAKHGDGIKELLDAIEEILKAQKVYVGKSTSIYGGWKVTGNSKVWTVTGGRLPGRGDFRESVYAARKSKSVVPYAIRTGIYGRKEREIWRVLMMILQLV